MRRRGFLGALAAITAVASAKAAQGAPITVSDAVLPKYDGPLVASGYVHNGFSFIERSGCTQHLGENGHLVAVTFPDGRTEFFNRNDLVVRRSLG